MHERIVQSLSVSIMLTASVFLVDPVSAALLDKTKVDSDNQINAPLGTIEKGLNDQIGAGFGSVDDYNTSAYLIKRDPIRAIRRGRQLFQRKFSEDEGLGPRVNRESAGSIVSHRALGAGFADGCAACHGLPRGSAGFGGHVATFPDGRDAPHLFGLGLAEQIADEITEQLREKRQQAIDRARVENRWVKQTLWVKQVYYGYLFANPRGRVYTFGLQGVDTDLRVKPFFADGRTASMREFIIGAFNDEMGMQAWDPVLCAATDPSNPRAVSSISGFRYDPGLDKFERPPVCDDATDGDADGIAAEVNPALIDYLEFYLLNYFKPATDRQGTMERRGLFHMYRVGCVSCHKQDMPIDSDRRVADVETAYDAERGIFNDLFASVEGRFEIVDDGNPYPRLEPEGNGFIVRNIFSDFKRHDLGPEFHERDYDGNVRKLFMTEPLWGVGSTAPYGHDGRSIDLDHVIRRHGGEAKQARDAYVNVLNDWERLELQQFLRSLVLFPPDDTASNLNPGNPDTTNPQSPAEHGNIKLPVLFQIPELGGE